MDLRAQLRATPDDLELRRVYADVLTAQGDPRGEFITLQLLALAGPLDPRQRRRMRYLEDTYGKRWLGPLAPLAHRIEYAGGFLSRVTLGDEDTPETAWAAVADE